MNLLAYFKTAVLDLIFPSCCFGCGAEGELLCLGCRSVLYTTPPVCVVCRKVVPAEGGVVAGRTCKGCRNKSFIYAFLSPLRFEDKVVRNLVHIFKYQKVRQVSLILGDIIVGYLAKFGVATPGGTIIVPVPLDKNRERTRGFNQAELIAKVLGTRLGVSVETMVLQKVKKTTSQVELSSEYRRKNLIGAFSVSSVSVVRDKTIILVDDVKTTGTTLEEAARVLKEAGAKRIWAITAAH